MNLNFDPTLLTTATAPAEKTPSKLGDAARQFESLLIGEMLKSARESNPDGWLGSGSDSGEESAMSLAETQFAQAIASQGGFGLANTIERSVSRESAQKENAAPERVSSGSLQ
jgi:Rod binding domain-containing protein